MGNTIKSGRDVIRDFLAEIYNVPGADPAIIDLFVRLYEQGRLTEKSIQTAVEQHIEKEIEKKDE
jgi:hypothetical protein